MGVPANLAVVANKSDLKCDCRNVCKACHAEDAFGSEGMSTDWREAGKESSSMQAVANCECGAGEL